jgi:SAM-dependent methyltransferase
VPSRHFTPCLNWSVQFTVKLVSSVDDVDAVGLYGLMPFNHNDFYHPLLLRQVPSGARTALDVGCGTGKLARRLAAQGLSVTGVDVSARVLSVAQAIGPSSIQYRQEDGQSATGRYDFITCVAALHHMRSDALTALRARLNPGGALAVLGLGHPRSVEEWALWGVLGPAANLAARFAVHVGERLGSDPLLPPPPIKADMPTMTEIRRDSAAQLPGRKIRVLLFWRYLMTYREPAASPG